MLYSDKSYFMKTNPREILIYYNPESSSDRKTVAYARSLSRHVKSYSHNDAQVTTTGWKGLLKKMDVTPKKLFNKALPEYQSTLKGKELDEEGWLHVIKHNTHLLRSPIAVRGNKAILCDTPTDIYRL